MVGAEQERAPAGSARTWVDGDGALSALHVHHPPGRGPARPVLHVEGEHAADLLDELLPFLQESEPRSSFITGCNWLSFLSPD